MNANRISRRRFLQMTAAAGVGLLGASALSGCGMLPGASASGEGPMNWLTWGDHFLPGQLEKIAQTHNIQANPALFSDNSEALLKLQQVGGKQLDMVSGDALWVPRYYEEGLIQPLDLNELPVSKELYSVAREFDFWTVDGGYLAYAFGWSPVIIAYNPKYVPDPDSWEVLWDPKYKGRIATEMQPFDVMANMGTATGAADPYDMNDEELQKAKQALIDLRPNILTFVEQSVESVQLLASEEVWISTHNLGVEERVKEAGGPEIKTFIPKEGTVGWLDGEMISKDAANRDVAVAFLNEAERAEWIADNFIENGRPLFNEKAYKLLVDNGHQERADRYLYNQPEVAATMTLKGPSPRLEEYINAFNEAIAG